MTDFDQYDQNPPTQSELIDYAVKMEAAATADPKIKATRSASISQGNEHSLLMATNGIDFIDSETDYQAVISAIAEDPNGMEVAYDYSIAHHFNDMADPVDVGNKAANDAISQLSPIKPSSKQLPIILSHDAAETFVSAVMASIHGVAVSKNQTFLADQKGKQVLSSEFTLIDDPTIQRGFQSQTADSSGQKSDPITFIENGVLKNFMVTLDSARELGIDPIGRNNGATNLLVLPGTKEVNELLKGIKEGIYITDFTGGTANVNNGDFSRPAVGKLIRDGVITNQAVAEFVVSGNLKDMFKNVTLANDSVKLPDTRHFKSVPTMRIDGAMIAAQ
jgi:PmbA protein